jgi:Ni,Fe-hydrogenase III component G
LPYLLERSKLRDFASEAARRRAALCCHTLARLDYSVLPVLSFRPSTCCLFIGIAVLGWGLAFGFARRYDPRFAGHLGFLNMSDTQSLLAQIAARFPDGRLQQVVADRLRPRIHVSAENWRSVAEFLRHDPQMRFDWLRCLSGVDYAADNLLCVVYDLWSFEHRHDLAVKVFTARETPSIDSVADLWPAADWHEREA